MKVTYRFSISLFMLVVVIAVLAVAALAFPAMAAPGTQDILPTPTLPVVENVAYTLETVGGADETFTFPGEEIDGFVISDTTARSEYPRGMVFAVTAESETGDISDVTLYVTYPTGVQTRVQAEWDPEAEAWIARPWQYGENQPAWTPFDFSWRVRDTSDAVVDTTSYHSDYFDPAREWFRMESEYVIVYWYGFGEDDPDEIARTMAERMAALYPRWVAGFGRYLSYKPIAVIYPDRAGLGEIQGSGATNDRIGGFEASDRGMTIQVLRDNQGIRGQENCIYSPENPEEYWTMERRISTIYHSVPHEVTHLTQYEVEGGILGLEWWSEGQAEWFAQTSRRYDDRLMNLSTLQDLPDLTNPIGSDSNQADGCYALSYFVGPSFVNFLVTNYGGIDTHRQVVELMRAHKSVFEAVEEVTGKPFMEIENEWRAYLGFRPLTAADLDPSLALEPLDDPVLSEGDTVTLPSAPPMVPVLEDPLPNAPMSGQCFGSTPVTILRMGTKDGVDYFEVDCMGQIGWLTRDQIIGPE